MLSTNVVSANAARPSGAGSAMMSLIPARASSALAVWPPTASCPPPCRTLVASTVSSLGVGLGWLSGSGRGSDDTSRTHLIEYPERGPDKPGGRLAERRAAEDRLHDTAGIGGGSGFRRGWRSGRFDHGGRALGRLRRPAAGPRRAHDQPAHGALLATAGAVAVRGRGREA